MRKVILFLAVSTMFLSMASFTLAAEKSAIESIRDALNLTSREAGLGDDPGAEGSSETTLQIVLQGIINTIVGVLGVIAVALMVYAGGLWLTSAGNDQKVTTAKTIIRSTVIGIIIVSLAYALTTFVITQLASGG